MSDLGFRINEHNILHYDSGGCHAASMAETKLWHALAAAQGQVAVMDAALSRIASHANAMIDNPSREIGDFRAAFDDIFGWAEKAALTTPGTGLIEALREIAKGADEHTTNDGAVECGYPDIAKRALAGVGL